MSHINHIARKVPKIIRIFHRFEPMIPLTSRIRIYHALILPLLNYCISTWGRTFLISPGPTHTKLWKEATRIPCSKRHLNRILMPHSLPAKFSSLRTCFITALFRTFLEKNVMNGYHFLVANLLATETSWDHPYHSTLIQRLVSRWGKFYPCWFDSLPPRQHSREKAETLYHEWYVWLILVVYSSQREI